MGGERLRTVISMVKGTTVNSHLLMGARSAPIDGERVRHSCAASERATIRAALFGKYEGGACEW